jgi:hypothetical protein
VRTARATVIRTGHPIPPDLAATFQKEAQRAARETAGIIANAARDRARKQTGAMARSIKELPVETSGNVIATGVGAGGQGAPYAQAQDSGSGLYGPRGAKYPIVPKTPGGVLAIPNVAVLGHPGGVHRRRDGSLRSKTRKLINAGGLPGAFLYVKKVMHPGVKPTYFLTKAPEAAWDKILVTQAAAVKRILDALG